MGGPKMWWRQRARPSKWIVRVWTSTLRAQFFAIEQWHDWIANEIEQGLFTARRAGSSMSDLADRRSAHNNYKACMSEVVMHSPHQGMADGALLTGAEIARRISDKDIRRGFIVRSIALLEADVRQHRHLATWLTPQRDNLLPPVLAIAAATVGYHYGGVAITLPGAAVACVVGYRHAARRLACEQRQAAAHNVAVGAWRQNLSIWKRSIQELSTIEP